MSSRNGTSDRLKTISTLLLAGISGIYLLVFAESVATFIFFVVLAILVSRHTNREVDSYLAFVVGCIVVIILYEYQLNTYGNHYYLGKFSDDYNYEMESLDFYNKNFLDFTKIYSTISILHNSAGFVYCLALLRAFGDLFDGYHTLLPRLLNLYVLNLLGHRLYLLGKTEYKIDSIVMKKTAFLLVIFPNLVFLSQNVFRDVIVSFIIFSIVYYLEKKPRKVISIFYVFLCLALLFFFRKLALYLLLLIIPVYVLRVNKIGKFLILVVLLAIIAAPLLIEQIAEVENAVGGYEELNNERFGTLATSIFALPRYIGIFPRISFLILNPFPGINSLEQFYSSISVYIQVLLTPLLFKALIDKDTSLRLKLTFGLMFLGVCLSTINFRHVTMYLPFLFLLAAIGYTKLRDRPNKYLGYLGGTLIYLLLSLLFVII